MNSKLNFVVGVVLSSSATPSIQSAHTEQPSTTTEPIEPPAVDSPENVKSENVSVSESNHIIAVTKAADDNDGVAKGKFLAVEPAHFGRSSRYN